ncbi:replication protein A 70 kDa DNA-binding subunit D [Artemisia annua]|uniref:Replication protein A 70 kDa DNA-binding subunit D n=1 Tax=Artemisia annua TaxID=35608 RepID=A0A2U1NJB8_ARTAN|nr:replication protein A 70 kDa DNA-binding subunit D [Artemisia annua]
MPFGYQEDFTNVSQTNENDENNISSITAKGKNATSGNDLEFTDLDQIDPMLDNIKIKARCISVWHSHPAGKPKQAYSFDVVLQDMKGNRIQCTARNNDMYRFEPLFQQGHCYMISDFSIGENNGILPLLNHKYKITFFQSTKVTRIDHFDEDVFGFKLEPFSDILSKKYNDKDSVDVIGAIVAIGDIIPIPNSLVKKVRRTVIIEDTEGTRVKCTFWDKWAEMFNQYVSNDAIGPVTFVLQLAKVKYFKDEPAVHNSLFGSRIFINKDIPAIKSFKQRYTAKEGYSDGDHKIEVFTPPVAKMTLEIFFKQTVKSTVGGVRDLESGTDVVIYGKVHRIHKEHGWCYDACKRCNKMARVSKSTGSIKAYTCDDHGVIYQVGDDQYKTPDVSSAHTGGLDAASLNINKFLLETPDNQAQSSTNRVVASSVNIDKFLLETPDNQVQTSANNSVGKNDGSSGSKTMNKKRDIIDVDELPDEVEAGGSAKKPLLAAIKTEEDE